MIRAGPAFVFLLCRGHRLTCRYRSLHICIHLQSCAYKRIMRMFANIPLNKLLTNKTTINTSAQIDRESRWTRHSEISDQCIHIYIYYSTVLFLCNIMVSLSLSLCLITSSWYIYILYICIYYTYIIHTYIHVVMFMYCVLTFNVKARDICCCNGGQRSRVGPKSVIIHMIYLQSTVI